MNDSDINLFLLGMQAHYENKARQLNPEEYDRPLTSEFTVRTTVGPVRCAAATQEEANRIVTRDGYTVID